MIQLIPQSRGRGPIQSRIIEDLGKKIVYGEISPGTIMRLDDLVAQYGVSRSAVRDGVSVLQSMGLVEAKRRVGITVLGVDSWHELDTDISIWRLQGPLAEYYLTQIAQFRATIEPVAAGRTARFHPEVGQSLKDLSKVMRSAVARGTLEQYAHSDVEFHRIIFHNCENTYIAELEPTILQAVVARHALLPRSQPPGETSLLLHDVIAMAVCDGDAVTAENAMRPLVNGDHEALGSDLDDIEPVPGD